MDSGGKKVAQLESELRQLNHRLDRFSKFVEGTDDLLTEVDQQGRLVYVNRAAVKVFGLEPEACVGQLAFDFIHPDDQEATLEAFGGWVKERVRSATYENRQVSTTGQVRYMLWTINPHYDDQGNLLSITSIARDITDRKELELRLRRSNEDLEQFAYVASHDLQEPLRMVSSFSRLLVKRYGGQLDQTADEYLGYLSAGAEQMHALVRDLLAFSRVSTRDRVVEEIDCEAVLERVLANLRVAIEESGVSVTCGPLPRVTADASQLVQLLQNLVSNAIKFRGEVAPEVHVSARRQGDEWTFSVRDNGIGIDPQHWERIFTIFQRLHASGKHAGTGIGLSICKKIVERHDGRIWLESEPGEGATFCFSLPATPQQGPDLVEP